MKILKAFIVAAVIECSVLNQERYRRQIDWNFVDSNSDENIEGIGEIFRIQKFIASVYVSDRYARTELALNVKNIDLVNSRRSQNDFVLKPSCSTSRALCKVVTVPMSYFRARPNNRMWDLVVPARNILVLTRYDQECRLCAFTQ